MALPARTFDAEVGDVSNDLSTKGPAAIKADLLLMDRRTAGTISIESYGASTSASAAANTTAIHNAIADMTAGMTLYVPPGTFNVTNVVFDPPSGCGLKMEGKFVSSAAGVALQIGGPTGVSRSRLICDGLWVESTASDWTAGRVGIKVENCYDGKFLIRYVSGFESGLELDALGATGTTYNKFYDGYFQNNRYSIRVRSSNAGGWTKENTFYSTTMRAHIAPAGFTLADAISLLMEEGTTYVIDNHRFFTPCFEGASGIKLAEIRGWGHLVSFPRMEISGGGLDLAHGIELCDGDANLGRARSVTVELGMHWDPAYVVDNGAFNKIIHGSNWILNFSDRASAAVVINSQEEGVGSTYPIARIQKNETDRFVVLRNGGVSFGQQNSEPAIRWGSVDPSSGSGVASGLGSIYIKRNSATIFDNFETEPYAYTDQWTTGSNTYRMSYTDAGIAPPIGGGDYCVKLPTSSSLIKSGLSMQEVWVEMLVRIGDPAVDKTKFLLMYDSSYNDYLTAFDTASMDPPKLRFYHAGGSLTGTTTMVANTWYKVKVHVIKNAGAGVVQVWLNDVLEINGSALNNGANPYDTIRAGGVGGETKYFDYFKVSETDDYAGTIYMKTGLSDTRWTDLTERHASSVLLGTVSATGDHFVYHADRAVVVEKITLVSDAGVAASDTDYYSFQVRNLTAAANLLSAAQTTKATGGTAIVADTAWDITPNQNATLAAGAIIELQVTKTLAPADLTRCTIFVHVRAAE